MARVLYVEDNPQNMRLVRKILKHVGYEFLEAENGLTGISIAKSEKPDLILMDINLPDIDGLETTRRIKALPDLSHIPIVALTGHVMSEHRELCLAAGCDDYISKPVDLILLVDTIARLIGD